MLQLANNETIGCAIEAVLREEKFESGAVNALRKMDTTDTILSIITLSIYYWAHVVPTEKRAVEAEKIELRNSEVQIIESILQSNLGVANNGQAVIHTLSGKNIVIRCSATSNTIEILETGRPPKTVPLPDGKNGADLKNALLAVYLNTQRTEYLAGRRTEETIDLTQFCINDYKGVDLRNAFLGQAQFDAVVASKGDLSGATLDDSVSATGTAMKGITIDGNILLDLLERNANLEGAILSNKDLSGFDLHDKNLTGMICRDTIFSGANLRGTIFDKGDLTGAIFSPKVVTTPDPNYSNDIHVKYVRTNLTDASLNDTTLTKADFTASILINTQFCRVKTSTTSESSPNFDDAEMLDVNAESLCALFKNHMPHGRCLTVEQVTGMGSKGHYNFSNIVLESNPQSIEQSKDAAKDEVSTTTTTPPTKTPTTRLTPSNDFSGKNLTHYIFTGANLARTKFGDATVDGANFTDSDLTGCDFTQTTINNLKKPLFVGVNLQGAKLNRALLELIIEQNNTIELAAKVNLENVDLSDQNLSGLDLSKFNLKGANLNGAKVTNLTLNKSGLIAALESRAATNEKSEREVNLAGINLRGAPQTPLVLSTKDQPLDLNGVNFTGAILYYCDLSWSHIANVNFTGVDLQTNTLTGASGSDMVTVGQDDRARHNGYRDNINYVAALKYIIQPTSSPRVAGLPPLSAGLRPAIFFHATDRNTYIKADTVTDCGPPNLFAADGSLDSRVITLPAIAPPPILFPTSALPTFTLPPLVPGSPQKTTSSTTTTTQNQMEELLKVRQQQEEQIKQLIDKAAMEQEQQAKQAINEATLEIRNNLISTGFTNAQKQLFHYARAAVWTMETISDALTGDAIKKAHLEKDRLTHLKSEKKMSEEDYKSSIKLVDSRLEKTLAKISSAQVKNQIYLSDPQTQQKTRTELMEACFDTVLAELTKPKIIAPTGPIQPSSSSLSAPPPSRPAPSPTLPSVLSPAQILSADTFTSSSAPVMPLLPPLPPAPNHQPTSSGIRGRTADNSASSTQQNAVVPQPETTKSKVQPQIDEEDDDISTELGSSSSRGRSDAATARGATALTNDQVEAVRKFFLNPHYHWHY